MLIIFYKTFIFVSPKLVETDKVFVEEYVDVVDFNEKKRKELISNSNTNNINKKQKNSIKNNSNGDSNGISNNNSDNYSDCNENDYNLIDIDIQNNEKNNFSYKDKLQYYNIKFSEILEKKFD